MNFSTKLMIFRFAIPLIFTNIIISNIFIPFYLIYSILFSCLPMILSMKTCFYISNTLNLIFLLTNNIFIIYSSYGIIYSIIYSYCSRLIITEQENIFNYFLKLDSISILISIILNINKLRQILICLILIQYINIYLYPEIPIDSLNDDNQFLPKTLNKIKPFINKNILIEYKKILEIKNSIHNINYKFIIFQSFLLFIPFTNNLYLRFFICLGIFIPLPKSLIGNFLFIISIIFDTPLLGFFGAIFSKYNFPITWNSKLLIRFIILKLIILWVFSSIFY